MCGINLEQRMATVVEATMTRFLKENNTTSLKTEMQLLKEEVQELSSRLATRGQSQNTVQSSRSRSHRRDVSPDRGVRNQLFRVRQQARSRSQNY
jgi:uncharacterized membrane protein YgaE (UPF0421/DUF939 family)